MWRLSSGKSGKALKLVSIASVSPVAGAGSIVLAQNAGLTVANLESLRRAGEGCRWFTMKIAKNRLAKLALKDTDHADISDLFTGPIVIAYAAQDPMIAPKIAAKIR